MIAGLLPLLISSFSDVPVPPAMPRRAIAPRSKLPGFSEEIEEGGQKMTLFLPDLDERTPKAVLTIHFHSAVWHAIQEHVDRGLSGPLIAFYPGEGSSTYEKAFVDQERLDRWIALVRDRMVARGWPKETAFAAIDVTSFSAGYGAVRQLVRQPKNFERLRRVILADSLYGSLATVRPDFPFRIPLGDHIAVWRPLAEAAMRGEKTFVITASEVPTEAYASSSEMALHLVLTLKGSPVPASPDEPAAKDPEFPLKARFDRGHFHVWQYGGQDAQAHMTHARHLADIWKALDRAGEP